MLLPRQCFMNLACLTLRLSISKLHYMGQLYEANYTFEACKHSFFHSNPVLRNNVYNISPVFFILGQYYYSNCWIPNIRVYSLKVVLPMYMCVLADCA